MSCQTGIKTAVEKYVQNKPYLNFDGKDFIEVSTSPARVGRTSPVLASGAPD